MKVAHLCTTCKQDFPTCENTKVVFGVDCKDILAYVQAGKCDKKYLDAVVACDGYKDEKDI